VTPSFDYEHVVTFDETNVVGNVYFVNHLRWQGHCRELFLAANAPGVIAALADSLLLVTTRCSCEYFAELSALDHVVVEMRLAELQGHRISMRFDYIRVNGDRRDLVARGEQEVVSLRREPHGAVAVPVPDELREALEPYRGVST
jgi:enediyne core biosynthesis thioesterase